MIGRTWREKAAHHAGLIDGVLVAWRNGFYSSPSQPRQPLEPFDGSLKILRESLLEDKEFFAWANDHIIQPLEKYDWTEEHAHRDVGTICKCIRHLVDRLRNGGAGTDLVSDLEVEHTSDSEGKNVADIGGMSDFWKLLTPEQFKRCDPLWRLKGELVHNRQKEKAPTPEEVWDEDELSIDDLALLADKSKLRDFLYDLEMLDRTINLQSGDVPANEQKEAVEIARKIRDLVAGIGKKWEKYAQDAFVSQIEGKKAGVRMYSVCESLRVRIDQAREGTPKVLHTGSAGENADEPMKKDKGKRVHQQIVQAVRELAEWGRSALGTRLPGRPNTISLSLEDGRRASSYWESACLALIPVCPVQALSVLRTWDGITEPISRLMNEAVKRYRGPALPDTLRQVDEWLALEKIGSQQVTDTKQEQPNLPASVSNGEQIVQTLANSEKANEVVGVSLNVEGRSPPISQPEALEGTIGLDKLLVRYPKVKASGAGPIAVLRVLISDTYIHWSQQEIANSETFKDAMPKKRVSRKTIGRWLQVLFSEGLAQPIGNGTAKRWSAGEKCRE